MEKITTVGLDLAKQMMAVHAVEADEKMVMRKVLRRDQLLLRALFLARPGDGYLHKPDRAFVAVTAPDFSLAGTFEVTDRSRQSMHMPH